MGGPPRSRSPSGLRALSPTTTGCCPGRSRTVRSRSGPCQAGSRGWRSPPLPSSWAAWPCTARANPTLRYRDGMWFLNATCEIPETEPNDPDGFLGIDLGIVNIATTSDGEIMAGRELSRSRLRERTLRTKLQKKNTPSAKRRLKKRRRKEARRARDINHKIAKHVVAEAERTGRGIALEDLTSIRERVRLRKPQRATHSSWSFAQLGQFIADKARRAGVPVVYVDPAHTSRTCAECGHTDKANRVSQAWFACRSCGFVDHADRNGSRNIRHRAEQLWRRGAQSTVPDPPPAPGRETRRKHSTTATGARSASPGL
ncbi:RNA-guided endonuclease InsQ/TnpB family protein [Streptomyces sp. NBC_00649]|uniref:RNA-guided endonuclease InsQ/TnpB family protein n=1 Tax=Streptomyces sp. NBC_00649 TaxID=2975798 RepID=UPI003250BA7D